jgi:signal transduction histidine kinase
VAWGIPLPTTNPTSLAQNALDNVSPDLLAALSEGMHTMAQPLTVLRATLEIASGNASSISHYQRAVDNSLIEVSRLAEAMGFVQELLRIAGDVSLSTPIELPAVVEGIEEDLRCVFEAAQVWLDVSWEEHLVRIQGSASRLRQCLFYLLQHAIRSTSEGDTIHLRAQPTGDGVRLVISSDSADVQYRELSWSDCLQWNDVAPYLTLAEALARADGGRLQWKNKPFVVALWLPAARSSATR